MKRLTYIFLFTIFTLYGCNHKQAGNVVENKAPADDKPQQQPTDSTSGILLQEKLLTRAASDMVQSADNYQATGSTAKEDIFIKMMLSTLKDAKTFKHDFASLKNYNITSLKSNDGRLKIFSWLSPYSGSMWHFQNILQYRDSANNVITASFNSLYKQHDDDTGPTPVFDKAYQLKTNNNTAYLLTGYGQMSGTEPYSVAHILTISKGGFNINKKIFLANGKPDNEIYANVNLLENQDNEKIKAQLSIKYDTVSQVITYPETKETKNNTILTGSVKHLKYDNGVFK
jgi:hypothetical protein